jgi:thioredoxin 2
MKGVVVLCEKCGQNNRIPFAKVDRRGKCGKCKAPLPYVARPLDVSQSADLKTILEQSSLPVLVDFWAAWCGPCRMVAPEMVKVAAERAGEWLVVKANTEKDPRIGAEHRVQSIPLMAVFEGGRELARTAGARPAAAIQDFVRQSLRAA